LGKMERGHKKEHSAVTNSEKKQRREEKGEEWKLH